MAKKLLAFLLTFALLLSTVATVAIVPSSAASVTVWDGTVATAFAGGSGTKDDPYQISNGAQLAYLVKTLVIDGSGTSTNGIYYKLTADIYLNDVTVDGWKDNEPNSWYAGASASRFRGCIDGAGHTVYGIYYSGTSGYVGLLPVIDCWDYDVVIKDISVSDSYIYTSGSIIGAISGRIYSDYNKTTHFYNVRVTDSVTVYSSDTGAYVGGFVGFAHATAKAPYQFSGCAMLAEVSSGHAFIGYGTASTTAKIIQSYAVGADWYPTNSSTSATTYLISDIETIKGATAAKEAMPGLDWLRIWNCKADGYPYPMNYNTNNVVGHVWTGLWSEGYAGGSGTAEDPYIIETPEQLARLVKYGSDDTQYYNITKDIMLNDVTDENWASNNPNSWFSYNGTSVVVKGFAGTIDGLGHSISGIYYNGKGFAGLFPNLSSTSNFENITIKDSNITITGSSDNNNSAAAFVGNLNLSADVKFVGCRVEESVTLTSDKSAAGFAGYGYANVTVEDSVMLGSITATRRPGAFFGDFWTPATLTVENSFAVGTAFTGARVLSTCTNSYNTVSDSYGTNVVTAEQMQGADALNNMPLLTGFGTTDTYPTIYQQGKIGSVWSGSVAADYAKGSGTKADPYMIETAEQLVKLVKDANTSGKYYELAADIKLNDTSVDNWTDGAKQWFGYNKAAEFPGYFSGTLNGANNTISGLYYNGSDYYAGLFAAITNATFNNIIVSESSLISSSTNGHVSVFDGTGTGTNYFTECVVDDTVTISGANASGYATYGGGSFVIDSCVALADVTGSLYAGAFAVDFWGGTRKITNSFAIGSLITKKSLTTSTNNYATVEGNSANVVTAEQMQGMTALDNMPLLTGYYATAGYPSRCFDGVEGEVWSGAVASGFASGTGTQTDPFMITTGEQLARIFTIATKGYYFAFGNDIVLGNEETANNWFDSSNAKAFAGVVDGNSYIVSGLNYDKTVTSGVYAGLIPVVNGGTVKNIILENSSVNMVSNTTNASYVGGIVGYNTGKATIYNCYVAEDVSLSNKVADGITTIKTAVGGILGGGNVAFEIDGCAFLGTLDYSLYRYGAVFGDVWEITAADRVVKNTFVDNYVPSSHWGFTGYNNVSTVAVADGKDGKDSFKVVTTLKGEEGFKAIEVLNRHGRYFGTESYPVVCALGERFMDVDGDRETHANDLGMLRNNFMDDTILGCTDINGDGSSDARDLVVLKKQLAEKKNNSEYELVWYDEFEGSTLDTEKWNTSQTRMADTTELAQSNIGSVRNVSDGNLQLTAMENPYYVADSESYFERHQYITTGSVTTENKMSFQYGYLEINAKVPYKEGCWPSFWLRSHNSTGKLSSPQFEVEVDVFEVFGNTTSMASNLHQQNLNGKSYQTKYSSINEAEIHTFDSAELSDEYHRYGFEWEPDRMAIYVDGVLQCEWNLDALSLWSYGLMPYTSGFDTTMNVLFNNHLFTASSDYSPTEDNIIENYTDNLPAEFDIDYVRLYQKNDGNSVLILGE